MNGYLPANKLLVTKSKNIVQLFNKIHIFMSKGIVYLY